MNGIAALAVGAVLLAEPSAAQPVGTGVPDGFTFVAGGDMIGPYHPLPDSHDVGFGRVAALFRNADLSFANQEGSIFEVATFKGWPGAETGGGYPLQPASIALQLKAAGIGLVSKANNHATDFGDEGLLATLKSLAEAGIAQGGAGLSDAQARAPVYVATPKGGAALVDTASTFTPMSVAGPVVERHGVITGPRPGISVLHVREVKLVSASEIAQLRALSGDDYSRAGEARISDQLFRAADHAGSVWEMETADETAILGSIREARRRVRFVLFSIHAHETAGDEDLPPPANYEPMVLHKANEAASPNDSRPAGFEPSLFHAAIDAGADVVVRTGPHLLNGIELYKGRPIFYSLGSLFFDFGGRRSYTTPAGKSLSFPDEWFETIVPVCTFSGGRVREIRLYPMVISSGAAAASGVPHPADPAAARRILKRVKAQSAPFGTRIEIENGVGIIRG